MTGSYQYQLGTALLSEFSEIVGFDGNGLYTRDTLPIIIFVHYRLTILSNCGPWKTVFPDLKI